jgi:hypothetical protein
MVASELTLPVGQLTVLVTSPRVYEPEWELMAQQGSTAGVVASR